VERGTGMSYGVRLWILDVAKGMKWVFVNLRAFETVEGGKEGGE
jgi:hypothetical protein